MNNFSQLRHNEITVPKIFSLKTADSIFLFNILYIIYSTVMLKNKQKYKNVLKYQQKSIFLSWVFMKIFMLFSSNITFSRKLKVKNRRKNRIICHIIQTPSTGHENNLYGAKVLENMMLEGLFCIKPCPSPVPPCSWKLV